MPGRYTTVVADYEPIIDDYSDISASMCVFSVLGTRYIRNTPAPDIVTVEQNEVKSVLIERIYSELPIGNTLDIKLRFQDGSELSFVTLNELSQGTEVLIDS